MELPTLVSAGQLAADKHAVYIVVGVFGKSDLVRGDEVVVHELFNYDLQLLRLSDGTMHPLMTESENYIVLMPKENQ